MKIWNELKNAFEGISNANKDFREGVRQDFVEIRREIISDWKKEVPVVGNTIEKVDRAITTYKNVKEHLPNPTPGPFSPDLQLRKILKEAKKMKDVTSKDSIKRAQHLKVIRFGYSHHALSISEYEVIHYQDGEVKIDSIEGFAKGAAIHVVDTPRFYKKDEVLARAYSKLGERNYNLLFNNCEHFVRWVLNGEN